MPEFKTPYSLITVKGISDYPDLELKMADSLTAADHIEITSMDNDTESHIMIMSKVIKEWNMIEEGKVMEITLHNLKRFSLEQLTEIYEKYNKEVQGVKKSSKAK